MFYQGKPVSKSCYITLLLTNTRSPLNYKQTHYTLKRFDRGDHFPPVCAV